MHCDALLPFGGKCMADPLFHKLYSHTETIPWFLQMLVVTKTISIKEKGLGLKTQTQSVRSHVSTSYSYPLT